MNSKRFLVSCLCFIFCGQISIWAQDIDKELSNLSEQLAGKIKDQGKKKVAVLDFTDLEGRSGGELGRYIAEQLTIDMVMEKREFSVLDRANLKKILAEHKLTATGLVDPDNAKKIGMFAGVDALIVGTIIPKGSNVNLTVKIITTDTAEIVGAVRAQFKNDEAVQQLVTKPATTASGSGLTETKSQATIVKMLGDLRVDLESLRIVDGRDYLITMSLANTNAKKSIWVAIRSDTSTMLTATLTDEGGISYRGRTDNVSGVTAANLEYSGEFQATEIKPGESLPCTVKLTSHTRKSPATGQCNLQMEFLIGSNSDGKYASGSAKTLLAKVEAE